MKERKIGPLSVTGQISIEDIIESLKIKYELSSMPEEVKNKLIVNADTLQGLTIDDFVLKADAYRKLLNPEQNKHIDVPPIGIGLLNNGDYLLNTASNIFAILKNGELYTTSGNNQYSSFPPATTGRGTSASITGPWGLNSLKKVTTPDISGNIKTVGGFKTNYAFMLMSNGHLYTWGSNRNGECGVGHNIQIGLPQIAAVNIDKVWSSNRYVLFVQDVNGNTKAAGYGGYGTLGTGDNLNRYLFTDVVGIPASERIVSIHTSDTSLHTFALTDVGKIYFTGYNHYGQGGNNSNTNLYSFTDVTNYWADSSKKVTSIKVITAKYSTLMMITYDDESVDVKTSGYGGYYQLGTGTTSTIRTPFTIMSGSDIKDIGAVGDGSGVGYMVLKTTGDLYAWGYNRDGELGNVSRSDVATPTIVAVDVAKIFNPDPVKRFTSVIQKTDGSIHSTGYNRHGECGVDNDIRYITRYTAVKLPSSKIISSVGSMMGYYNARTFYALTADNKLYAWGCGKYNQITNDTTDDIIDPLEIDYRD